MLQDIQNTCYNSTQPDKRPNQGHVHRGTAEINEPVYTVTYYAHDTVYMHMASYEMVEQHASGCKAEDVEEKVLVLKC